MSGEEDDRCSDCLFTSTPGRDSLDDAASFLQSLQQGNISQFSFPSVETLDISLFNEASEAPSISPSEFADIKSDSADPRAPSPSVQSVSSVASTQRLEWDSGADIGYGGKSVFGLSTLERMAIGSCCSALQQGEPKDVCVLTKSDSNEFVQIKTGQIGYSEGEGLEADLSKLEALDEKEDQIQAYRRHLVLKEIEEESMLPPKSTSKCTEYERFDRLSDINTRIMALRIAERRSSSMNDLSDPDGKKTFKRIHSYSAIDVSPAKQPANTMGSASSSCSAVSLNSSNTVIAPLSNNCFHDAKKNYSLQSCSACGAVTPKTSGNGSNSKNAQQHRDSNDNTSKPETDAKLSCDKAVTCNSEVVRFVDNFVHKLLLNSGDARKQHLLRKILEDLDVLLKTDKDKNKLDLLDDQHDKRSNIELQDSSSSQQMPMSGNSFHSLPVTERKPCNTSDSDLDGLQDFGIAFHGQQCSIMPIDSKDAEVSVSATEHSISSSSERESTSLWMKMQQLGDVESLSTRSSADSSERLGEEFSYPRWSYVHRGNQDVMDSNSMPSSWWMFNDLRHKVAAQQESLKLVKGSVRQQWRRNMHRLQKDMRWLKHVEGMLHTKQVKQANADSSKYRLRDVEVQCALDEGRINRESFLTKDSGPSARCAGIFVCVPSTLTSGTPAAANNHVKHSRSIGIQTSLTRLEPYIFEKEQLDAYSVDKPAFSLPQTVRRKSTGYDDGTRANSTELFTIFSNEQARPVAWFLPLNESPYKMSRAERMHRGGFRYKAPLYERGNSQLRLQDALQKSMSDKNPTTNNKVGLEEIRGGFRKYTVPVSVSSQHHNPKYRRFSHNDMQEQTEKVYNILPEVTAKNELKHRRDAYKTNRLMAKIFQKNLQKKVLAGRSSFLTTEKCQC